ncbi:ORC ubiquitin ligase 1 [Amia ocellicauda]|uniref:ORC ubiquitin ligase 1 n=1 Tax=Amia ocellicauda TaxID=2972642 RepID=UPI003464850D
MAQSVQNVTLSLTLPISCQICLGKVRHPVICGNYHVFCSACIAVWLKKARQCPTCRIPITPEAPCREIIGATNESEANDSYSIRKHLRKTRSELLLKEYEDEIEALQKENEELKNKNLSIESQLKTVLNPSTIYLSHKTEDCKQNGEDNRVDPNMLQEWTNKLKASTDIYEKVKSDMEKLKEANKNLRTQNFDLVRENLRLKAEVENRSPQKFGRFTVAALEAKIEQHERDATHLRRALERSDKYIEDLEGQVTNMKKTNDEEENVGNSCEVVKLNTVDSPFQGEPSSEQLAVCNKPCKKECHGIANMSSSASGMEEAPECTDLANNGKLSRPCRFIFSTATKSNASSVLPVKKTCDDITPKKDKNDSDLSVATTPSSSFGCLSLNSPRDHSQRKSGVKPLSYLRKLSFDDEGCSKSSKLEKDRLGDSNGGNIMPGEHKAQARTTQPVFWGKCHADLDASETAGSSQAEDQPTGGKSKCENVLSGPFQVIADSETNRLRMSSEASMEAAYLDKISELDTMISESESSRGSHFSLMSTQSSDLDITLIPELAACTELMNEVDGQLEEKVRTNQRIASCSPEGREGKNDSNPVSMSNRALRSPEMKEKFCLSQEEGTQVSSLQMNQGFSQSDEMSFDLLFDSHGFSEEAKPGSSSSSTSTEAQLDQAEGSSPFHSMLESESVKEMRSTVESTKRKCKSGFNIASPSKISKYDN